MNTLHRTATLVLLGLAFGAAAQPAPPGAPPAAASQPATAATNSTLNAPLFYQLLLGELNVQAGEPGTGYSLILDAARRQRDPELYRRAVDVALQARSGEAALTAARAWAQEIPGSPEANRFVLQILLALNRVAETAPVLQAILQASPVTERNDTINAIPQTYGRVPDKALASVVVREALAPALKQPFHAAAAWTTVGRMELARNQMPQAMAAAREGHAIDPASPYPALLALELMERGEVDAEPLVRQQLQAATANGPGDIAVALAYARILLDLQRNSEARAQLEALTARQPDQAEPWLLLASLQTQDNALPAATTSLQKYMALARQSSDERIARGLTQAYLLMAQIAEKQNDLPAANAWLDRIENADDIMAAQVRRASLLARQGQMPQARALLRDQPERRPEDARLKLVAEAQLLRDFKAYQQAYEVYNEAAARFPDDTDLIYDQAMMADKAGKPADMERLLRQLIVAKPDYHHAYNALGYSLADRNQRLPEAKQLIEKAVALAPGDAYIQDSLGWVEFRMGNMDRALSILQAAYRKRPDPEIAAHLGEVLWVQGQREQALKVWREGLLLAADNETLQDTLKRLQVKP
ncbi:tetratricopeptide repeat protein [Hydrogenophaga laconesensis]|uniref:Tetratricopeptide (TPR) repeat protein n=1 Tax=Hydrogenophaga laconesensis TaxID=1805971 RepID=A0ABU1VCE5_9BURK|nr:tetratricopeptide repeat protein [Hydrogenophaga laconesensis]MDR7095140.1 tetratricopeptide (TPR) repeat protein [Hydrogenophaga laconesensis]